MVNGLTVNHDMRQWGSAGNQLPPAAKGSGGKEGSLDAAAAKSDAYVPSIIGATSLSVANSCSHDEQSSTHWGRIGYAAMNGLLCGIPLMGMAGNVLFFFVNSMAAQCCDDPCGIFKIPAAHLVSLLGHGAILAGGPLGIAAGTVLAAGSAAYAGWTAYSGVVAMDRGGGGA